MVEDFHHPLAVDHLFNIAVHRTQGLLLTDEVSSGLASQIFGGEDNQGDGKQHNNEQQPTGIDKVPGNHHQGNQRGGALGNGLAYHLAQGVHVAGVAGHNVAGGVGIEIAQGQTLHLYEHLVPDGLLGALADAHHQIVIQERAEDAHCEDSRHFQQKLANGAKVCGAGGYHGQDIRIHQCAQAAAALGLGNGGEEDTHQHDYQNRKVLTHIAQQTQQRLLRVLCHAAIAAHFHRGHYSSLPFCWVS